MPHICGKNLVPGKNNTGANERTLKALAGAIRAKFNATRILVYGSHARGDVHEGSDIDLLVVGDFQDRFHQRTVSVLEMTDLPVEPLCYTESEFQSMIRENNPFIREILNEAIDL